MNKGRKLKQLRKFINKYGVITQEYEIPPDKYYYPYRKGSYFAVFQSDKLSLSSSIGDIDKYEVYKSIAKLIKFIIESEDFKDE